MNRVSIASNRLSNVLVVCVVLSGCATRSPLLRQQCYDADAQLASVLQPLEALRAKGCSSGIDRAGGSECNRLEAEIARLAVVCPGHAPTLMANAVIAYDNHRPQESQQFLDQILSQPRPYPDAAVLRAQIALEEGNIPFARRLVEQQIKLVPDHAGLHEAYAAALFLDKRLDDARTELTTAGALGAPRWRVAYHLGVIEELSGRPDEAARLYMEALQGNPGWAAADSRLRALRAASPPVTAPPP
jgi:tetratricopeptide (TPR) repeat protein